MYKDNRNEEIKTGDFFAVVSCMARRPAIETVESLTQSELIAIEREQFVSLININSPIAMKIIRYFSMELRHFNSILTELSLKSSLSEDPKNLYNIAMYYLERKMNYPYAVNAFVKYLKFCPNGELVQDAKIRLSKLLPKYKPELAPQKEGHFQIVKDKDVIFFEHEPGNELYIIQEGEVRIFKIVNNNEVLLNILKPGDIFGEMAILENKPRNATATASGTVKLMAVSKTNFDFVVKKHPEIADKIITLLSERIWFMHSHISNMLISDPETRLYDALYLQLIKNRVNIRKNEEYVFDFEFDDLIRFSGLEYLTGERALRSIIGNGEKFFIKNGKIACKNTGDIERTMNVIKRNAQVKQGR
jgi:CRP/FNR family transcriptional regulator